MDVFVFRDDPNEIDYRSVDKVDKDVIFIDTPVKSIPQRCRDRKGEGDNYPARGECIRVCPIPHRPKHLDKHLTSLYDEWLPKHLLDLKLNRGEF